MKIIYLVIFMVTAVTFVAAQDGATSTVAGIVTGPDDELVKEAHIEISCNSEEKVFRGATDRSGRFEIAVPSGTCRIKAFKDKSGASVYSLEKEVGVSLNSRTTIDLSLTESASIREEVDVRIASGTSQPFSEVAKTISVIEGSEISERNEISIADTIRTVPGFRVQQLGGLGRTASVKTRGLRNQDTAVLLDGQRLRDPSSINGDATPFLSDLNIVNVAKIEVLRGSGSSVYGTNAIGGVIDIQTDKAENGFRGGFFGEYGGLGFSRFEGVGSYGSRGERLGISGGISRLGVTEGIDGEDDAANTSFRFRVDAVPLTGGSLYGSVYYSDSFVRLNANPDTLGSTIQGSITKAVAGVNFIPDANDPDSLQRTNLFSAQIGGVFALGTRAVVSASYQGLKTARENENGGLGPGFQPFGGTQLSFFDGEIHTINTRLDWSPIETGRLIAGFEYEREKYSNQGIGPSTGTDFLTKAGQSSNTMFTQYLASFAQRRLQIAGGFRVQAFRLESPRFGILNPPYSGVRLENPPAAVTFDGAFSYYFPKSATKLRGHIGNGYRVPSLYERFGSFYSSFSQSFTALGDPSLEPERSVAFDAGIDQFFFDGRVDLSATYFYTRLRDTIGFANVAPDIGSTPRPFGGYENTHGGIARGVELSSRVIPLKTTRLFASYTYTNSDQREPQVFGSGIIKTLGIPVSRFTLNATQVVGSRITINFDFEATSEYLAPIFSTTAFSTDIYRFDGNRRADIAASYRIPFHGDRASASLFATIENLFGVSYYDNGFQTAGRTFRAGVGLSF